MAANETLRLGNFLEKSIGADREHLGPALLSSKEHGMPVFYLSPVL
jgi:hypothetical protein